MTEVALPVEHRADAIEAQLEETIGEFYLDPLGFVLFAFDWGTGELAGWTGPDEWQTDFLRTLGREVARGASVGDAAQAAVRLATTSGHGVGKTALVAWIVLWMMSTRPNMVGVVTANTVAQLEQKTWRELALWHKRAINTHWFDWTATRFKHKLHPETWRVDAVPWREDNPEAFAGLHGAEVLLLFDEASAIADAIWTVAEGATTTDRVVWCVFGNPTRNEGRFRQCFGPDGVLSHRWVQFKVDSRRAKAANPKQIADWLEDHGEDSDFFRVRVRGEFPATGDSQFFRGQSIQAALDRELFDDADAPLILSVDVARFGGNETVIRARHGWDLRRMPTWRYQGLDTMETARVIAERIDELRPDAVFLDETGVGGGVVDRLRQMGYRVSGVMMSRPPQDDRKYGNRRTELYGRLRDWLEERGCLGAHDGDLITQLKQQTFKLDMAGRQVMEHDKNTMRKLGMESPDDLDAVALGFAEPVARRDARRYGQAGAVRVADNTYDVFGGPPAHG